MSHNGTREWMNLDFTANSLYSVIADGMFQATTAGRAAWKSIIADSSLQHNCNKEGFNVPINGRSTIRLGIVANNQNDCNSCDSWLGLGATYDSTQVMHQDVCGNRAICCKADNGNKNIKTFGYIFVQ